MPISLLRSLEEPGELIPVLRKPTFQREKGDKAGKHKWQGTDDYEDYMVSM